MDTAKVYYDSDDNECTIHQMVKREPDWAANRIQEGEKAIDKLAILESQLSKSKKEIERLRETLNKIINCSGTWDDGGAIAIEGIIAQKALNTEV